MKVALLLRLLEEEVALELVKHLDDRDIARIHRADADLGTADEGLLQQVAADFRTRISQGSGTRTGPRIESLVRRAFQGDRVDVILGAGQADLGRIEDTLAGVDTKVTARILAREYPQTAAMVLSQINSQEAVEILEALPDEIRVEVVMRLARLESVSEEMLVALNRALSRELSGFETASNAHEMGGIDLTVKIFNQLDRASEQSLMDAVEERDSELANAIRERMFIYEDLRRIDDRGIQSILRNVENQTLVLALKGSTEEMKDLFLRNVSQRVASSLVEDLETMGPVRLSEVEGAQQKIANAARELVDRGEVMMEGRGDDVLV
ncbi:MAG: flagellar motor switch protein FliG [Myxococcota bacterium]